MDRTKHKTPYLWITAAVFLLCVTGGLFFHGAKETPKIIMFGDSRIVGPGLDETIPSMVEKETGMSVLSAAFGGSTLTASMQDIYSDTAADFSMVSLSRLAAFGDPGALTAVTGTKGLGFSNLEEHKNAASGLALLDISGADFIVIAHGVNDATLGIPAGDPEDPCNPKTFEGALRESVANIRAAAPGAKIILLSPVFFSLKGLEDRLGLLGEYRDAEASVAKEYGLILADAYTEAGITEKQLADGLHYNDEGARLVADIVIKAIKDNR